MSVMGMSRHFAGTENSVEGASGVHYPTELLPDTPPAIGALEPDVRDGVATALSCGVTLEASIDGRAPRISLNLTNTNAELKSVATVPANGCF